MPDDPAVAAEPCAYCNSPNGKPCECGQHVCENCVCKYCNPLRETVAEQAGRVVRWQKESRGYNSGSEFRLACAVQRQASEIQRLLAKLKRYGTHDSDCDYQIDIMMGGHGVPCTCGLGATIDAKPETESTT